MEQTKVAIICDEARISQRLIHDLNFLNLPVGEVVEKHRDSYVKVNFREPRVVLFCEPSQEVDIVPILASIKKLSQGTPIIYIGKNNDFEILRNLFRIGVDDFLQFPEELSELERCLEKAFATVKGYQQGLGLSKDTLKKLTQANGTVLTVFSGKGGAGASLLAGNLAHSLALHTNMRILLVDLNLQFSNIGRVFNIKHERNLGDLKPVIKELTDIQISNVLFKRDNSNLSILLSPNSPEEAETFKGEDIELLLNACRSYYDLIILDIPKELNEVSIAAIGHSDYLCYIATMERPAIQKMQNIFDILERYQLIKDETTYLVINRFSKHYDIGLNEITRMVRFEVLGTIEENFKQIQTNINLGTPWLTSSKDKVKRGPVRDLLLLTKSIQKLLGVGGE